MVATSMILGTGVDLVHTPRILALCHRNGYERFARRILSSSEYTDWKELGTALDEARVQFLAVR